MNATRFFLSATLVLAAAATSACATPAAPDTDEPERAASAQQDLEGGYGYEFHPDRLGATQPPAAQPPAEVSGRLAPEIALDVLRGAHGALQGCREAAIARRETPQGEARLRIRVSADGSVLRVQAGDVPPAMAACVQQVLGALRFPRSTDGHFDLVYPLLLGTGS